MKGFELKYTPMAMQIFVLPLLFPYLYELGLKFLFFFFFFHEELLYLLTPSIDVASTAVTAAELCTMEVVVDRAAHGTPKEPCKLLAWLQTDLRRGHQALELTPEPKKNRYMR